MVPRLLLIGLAVALLVSGVMAGIVRLGVEAPVQVASLAAVHGPLMICAFFGSVISLERAVAIGRSWAYLAPLASGMGGLALITGASLWWSGLLFVMAALVLLAANVVVIRRHMALHTVTLLLGALCWLAGNAAWLHGGALPVAAWLAFLVITIAGERLELTRLLPRKTAATPLFVLALALVFTGSLWAVVAPQEGGGVFGLGGLSLALWLGRYDIARHNLKQRGLTRFIALCLLSGYVWLGAGGIFAAFEALHPDAVVHDALLHSIGLGFVVAMVFGHAPIILPAVAAIRVVYHPFFYLPLGLLHLSLALRVLSSLLALDNIHRWAGIGNAVTLAIFAAIVVSRSSRGASPGRGARLK